MKESRTTKRYRKKPGDEIAERIENSKSINIFTKSLRMSEHVRVEGLEDRTTKRKH